MKKFIPIFAFVFICLLSYEGKAQVKESMIIHLHSNLHFENYEISLYLNNEKKSNGFGGSDGLLELHKLINKLQGEGWKITGTDASIAPNGHHYLFTYLERDKK